MSIFFSQQKNKKVRAFTLLEVLASLSIVTMVILGPLTFSVNASATARQTKDIMVSMYLAQEAFELLHFQYDSLYIACAYGVDACEEGVYPTLDGESPGGKAWRLFKTKMNTTSLDSPVSCFGEPGVNEGCSYDFLGVMNPDKTEPPKKYLPTATDCPNLAMVNAKRTGFSDVRNYYVCSGHITNGIDLKEDTVDIKKTSYIRKIFVQSLSTFDENPSSLTSPANPELYQDDLLVTVLVSFRRTNGVMRTMKYTDFFHSRS